MNKAVACLECNEVKRGWDKKYDDALPVSPSPKRVARARQSATEYILKHYAVMATDFGPMMNEIDIAASADAEEGIRQGLEAAKKGRTRPVREFFDEFEATHGIPREHRFPQVRFQSCKVSK